MMKMRIATLALFWILGWSLATENARSATLEVTLDSSKHSVQFSLGATLHTVHGTFAVKKGSLRFDPVTGNATGEIVVDVRSGQTGNTQRDQQMHEKVLESQRFPEAFFVPDHVTGKMSTEGEYQVTVHGTLRIHGQSHDLTIPAKIKAHGGRITATARLSIPYVAWGMKDPSTFLLKVNKAVDLEMTVTGQIR